MRYIKKIIHSADGYIPSCRLPLWRSGYPVSVIIRDTERNADLSSTVYSLDESRDFGYGLYGDFRYLVSLEGKHLGIHKYIDAIWHSKEEPCPQTGLVDYVMLRPGSANMSAIGEPEDRILFINMGDIYARIFGRNGSVCAWHGVRSDVEIYTLYDLLCKLCIKTALNVMRYQQIILHSEPKSEYSTIKPSHTSEAERFFMKMYLDATRKAR